MKKLILSLTNLKTGLIVATLLVMSVHVNAQLSIWHFDDNANASPATYNATLVGSPTYAAGRVNNALSLSGTGQYATTPFVFNPVSSDFTVTAWVKYTGTISQATLTASPVIVQQMDDTGNGRGLLWLSSYSATASQRYKFASSLGNSATYGTTTVAANTWYMVSVTKVGTSIKIYVNGALETTSTRTSETTIGGLRIGTNKTGTVGTFWNGQIDELAVYNTELSATDLLALYQSSAFFRSTATGNWATTATWQSSANNSTWVAATAAPTSSAAAITVQTGHVVTAAAAASASALTVNSGGTVEVAASQALTVTGALTNNGTLTLKNGATAITNTMSGSGTSNVEQELTAGRNWYISSPVSTALSSVFDAASSSTNKLYWYNETQGSSPTLKWPQITDNSSSLIVTRGYVANMPANGVVTFTGGTLNTGNITTGLNSIPALSRTALQTKEGFNLVGNPYPSYLNWTTVSRTNVDATMWYRTKVGINYKYYTYLSGAANGLEEDGVTVPAGVSNLIPPMQAFWVRVSAGQTSGTLGFTNSMRAHKDIAGNTLKAPSAKKSSNKLVRLQVSNGVNDDETVIYFNPNVTNGLDTYDAPKMFNNVESMPEIFTTVGDEKLVINGFSEVQHDTQIPLGFVTGEGNSFTLSATEVNNFATDTKIILKDNLNPTVEFDLTAGAVYSFSSGVANDASRFTIFFRAPGAPTGVAATEKQTAQVFVNAANQITIIAPEKSNYAIYNAVGMLLERGVVNSALQTVNHKLQTGVYVVKVGTSNSTRVIIK